MGLTSFCHKRRPLLGLIEISNSAVCVCKNLFLVYIRLWVLIMNLFFKTESRWSRINLKSITMLGYRKMRTLTRIFWLCEKRVHFCLRAKRILLLVLGHRRNQSCQTKLAWLFLWNSRVKSVYNSGGRVLLLRSLRFENNRFLLFNFMFLVAISQIFWI